VAVPFVLAVIVALGVVLIVMGKPKENDAELAVAPDAFPESFNLVRLAQAISRAEGYGIAGAIPTLANNPGNLVIPGWTGATLGAERISVFESAEIGWQRLYKQIELIISGRSRVYTLDDTIYSMGGRWAPHDPLTWANNVAAALGVAPEMTLRALLVGE
jgi:hypothetical protein